MKLVKLACTTLVWPVALTTGLAASGDQGAGRQPARPEPAPLAREDARVIRTLPRVAFGPSTPQDLRLNVAKALAAAQQRTPSSARPPAAVKDVKKSACGMPMMEQSPDLDAKILLPPDRSAGAAVRRIEPQGCTTDRER
jgi:hypothetical protein